MSDEKPSAGAIEAANQFYSNPSDRDTAALVIERVAVAPRLAAAEAHRDECLTVIETLEGQMDLLLDRAEAAEADVERLREALSLIGNIVGDEKEIVVVLKAPYPDLIRAALAETEPR